MHQQGWARPVVVGVELEGPRVLGRAGAVLEPVADHELQPRRDQRVAGCRRDQLLAGHQPPAHGARVGLEQVGGVGPAVLDRHVAPEPRAGHPHRRVGQVVPAAVDGALRLELLVPLRRLDAVDGRLPRGVVQVELAEHVAHPDQVGQPQVLRQARPAELVVDPVRDGVVRPPERVEVEGAIGGALRARRVRHGHSSAPSVGPLMKTRQGGSQIRLVWSRPRLPRAPPQKSRNARPVAVFGWVIGWVTRRWSYGPLAG